MSNLYGLPSGLARVSADQVGPVLNVRFRRWRNDPPLGEWYVAEDRQARERIVLLPNQNESGGVLEPRAETYSLLLYIASTTREQSVVSKLASQTPFRFLEHSNRVSELIERLLPQPE